MIFGERCLLFCLFGLLLFNLFFIIFFGYSFGCFVLFVVVVWVLGHIKES